MPQIPIIPNTHLGDTSSAFKKEKVLKVFFSEIQDGGEKEGVRGNLKFDLQSESYCSILAIIHFYDVL